MRVKDILSRLALGRPETRAWALYDWANSAFMLTVITAVFPLYFLELVGDDLDSETAQARYAATTRNALIAVAIAAPLLGAFADQQGARKRLLGIFAAVGALSTAAMFTLLPGDWNLALWLFAIANVGAAGSVVFYDALLPHVARRDELDQLSTTGFAVGYVGSGLLLIVNLACIQNPEWFGLPHGEGLSVRQSTLPTRVAFLSVAAWWMVFTLPLLLRVREPAPVRSVMRGSGISSSVTQLAQTLRELRSHKEAMKMLLAFMVYNDGIATIIRMSVIYAGSKGLDEKTVIGSILALQFIGVPFSILFGRLSVRVGVKPMILVGLGVYSAITVFAYFMTETWQFVALAVLVGMVQGGTQGLSRSLFASMIPASRTGEFFALFGVFEKFASILGPTLYGAVILWTGSSRTAILSILVFFALGAFLLVRVDVEAGRRSAVAEPD